MWSSEAIFLFTPLLFLGIEGVTGLTPQASPYQNLPTKVCCLCDQVILLIKPSLPLQGWASQRENLVIRYFSNQMVSGSLLALAALLTHCLRYSCLAVKRYCVQGDLPKKHLIGGLPTAWEGKSMSSVAGSMVTGRRPEHWAVVESLHLTHKEQVESKRNWACHELLKPQRAHSQWHHSCRKVTPPNPS